MTAKFRRLRVDTKGTIAVYFAIAAVPLIGLAAAANEIGVVLSKENALQRASDAAAYSAARRWVETEDEEEACQAASASLENSSITSYMLSDNWCVIEDEMFKVSLGQSMERKMSRMFRRTDYLISSTSTAKIMANESSLDDMPCVLALSNNDENSIKRTSNGGNLDLGSCWMHSNSDSNKSIKINSGFRTALGCVQSHGGIKITGGKSWNLECEAVEENKPRKPDPFEGRSSQLQKLVDDRNSYGEVRCGGESSSDTSKVCSYSNESLGSDGIGYFPNGLKFNGNINLEPGVYIIAERFEATKWANVVGTNVALVFLDDVEIIIDKKADIALYAPKVGTFEGIVITGQLSSTPGSGGSSSESSGSGSGSSSGSSLGSAGGPDGNLSAEFKKFRADLDGALYFPQHNVKLDEETKINESGTNNCTKIIAQSVEFSGNMEFYTSCPAGKKRIKIIPDPEVAAN